ncbi:hypothetical protein IM538_13965 [Cytobacillus suaedae]|nr:hypothetical protein IM538_13965 [Cytobacillus suaedae]
MKKFLVVFTIIIIGLNAIIFIYTNNKSHDLPKIYSKLIDNGIVDGKREFIYSLENMGKENAKLQFLTWLEYNYTLDYLTDQDVVSLDGTTEHIDLVEENDEGRTLLLKPNERIEYRLHLSGFPAGEYEITISPAANGNYDLGFRRMEFVIE